MSVFFCDTNSELAYDTFLQLNIQLIKMPYSIDDNINFYDLGKGWDYKSFFAQMRDGAVPKTQALNEYDYTEYFEPILKQGENILYVSFSHQMSGTFQQMNAAIDHLKQKYPDRKITVVDTKGISMAAGIVVYYAALKHNEGASDEEVCKFVESFREKVGCHFTVGDLVYLKRGGRISSFKAAMGTLLGIKPIISITNEGKLENDDKAKGRKSSIKRLVELLEENNVDIAYPITILNADCFEDAQFAEDLIKEKYSDAKVNHNFVGPVIGSHCGPDTVGVIYVKK